VPSFIVDASIAAAWFLEDESSGIADSLLERLQKDEGIVPDLFWHEIRHLMTKAVRRQRATHEEALKHLRDIRALGLKERGGGPDHVVMHLASAHGLSAYDACHLSLAIEMGCELFSLDKELHAAWEAEKQTARPTPAETD
jgi:predicted nucleic acid-binding protein